MLRGVRGVNGLSYAQRIKILAGDREELEFFYCQILCYDVIINLYLRPMAWFNFSVCWAGTHVQIH